MYSNQSPPLYTTRHYIHDPKSDPRNNYAPSYDRSRPPAQPYPYYTNNQPPPTTVTYINDRSNYGQQSTSYVPPNANRYPSTNYPIRNSSMDRVGGGGGIEKTNMMSSGNPFIDPARPYEQYNTSRTVTSITSPPKGGGGIEKTNMMSSENPFIDPARPYEQYNTSRTVTSITSPPKGGGGIEKTNMMSSENPFIDPARPYEQYNTPRSITSITSPPKSGGGVNKSLNLSDQNPFHSVYGGYHYPSQIDPSKRITTQNSAARSTDNKSLNLSDENPFYATYGRYHYPSQIDPSKRITEMPKATGPLVPTNEMSGDNPFSNYRPPSFRDYSSGGGGSNSYSTANNNPAPLPYRPIQAQRPLQDYYNQPQPPSVRPPKPPTPPPPARAQSQKLNSSAPMDKTSLNMSPDNPFAETHGQYHYPSTEEIKSQKRANERNARFEDQQPVINNNNTNNRPVQPTNQMTEYPETEKKEIVSGKGNTKFTRFDVDF